MVDFGARLKQLRAAKHLTQVQVAGRLGVTKAMVSAYENGIRLPSYDILVKLAALFNTTTDYLLGVERARMLNVTGLGEREIETLNAVIDLLKNRAKPSSS